MNIGKLQQFCRRSIKGVIPNKARSRLPSGAKCFILAMLSFTLAVTWGNAAWGQIPFLNLVGGSSNDKPIVDFFNRPYQCGNVVCSNVWFAGIPILEIASEPTTQTQEDPGANFSAELRAKRIQNNLQEILKASQASSNFSSSSPRETEETIEESILPNSTPGGSQNSTSIVGGEALHPNLPQIEVGTLNNETVIYLPEQRGQPNRKILTITRADVLHNGIPKEELAYQWREKIRSSLNKALKERDRQARNPLDNLKVILALFLVMLLLSLIVAWVQKRLRIKYKTLRSELRELESSMAIDPESASGEQLAAFSENNDSTGDGETPEAKMQVPKARPIFANQLESLWRNLPKLSLDVSGSLIFALVLQSFKPLFWTDLLKKQSLLKKQINILLLLLQGLLWVQGFIWLCGTAVIFAVYPNTRAVGVLLILRTFPTVGIWVLVTLLDKISHFAIDFNLNKWAENAQFTGQISQRYALRVSTYSAVLNNLSSVIFGAIGAIWTAEVLGIATTVLASAGVMVAVVTYFSQNLVRDAINGLLILLTDRYAVGDVISVGDAGGLVEKMNLYMTNLRSADGELITIPNGSITVVRNLTKDWSRVNFTIEVAYDAPIKRALQLLREVAKQFYAEPEWQEYLLEPIEVLGVDEVSHAGMLVRIWLKTQPMKQWLVGREFRLRVKQAFDREGISIGIPKRSLSVTSYSGFPNTNDNGKGKEQDRVGHG